MKNVKIIALWGKSNRGKTATLCVLIDLFSTVQEFEVENFAGQDRCVLAELNGKKIGIITAGDTERELNEGFDVLPKCDFYVCASRTKGGSIKAIRHKSHSEQKDVFWISKWSVTKEIFDGEEIIKSNTLEKYQVKANRLQAKEIYDILDELTK